MNHQWHISWLYRRSFFVLQFYFIFLGIHIVLQACGSNCFVISYWGIHSDILYSCQHFDSCHDAVMLSKVLSFLKNKRLFDLISLLGNLLSENIKNAKELLTLRYQTNAFFQKLLPDLNCQNEHLLLFLRLKHWC